MNKSKLSVRQMCVLALFLAIEIIMYLTPIGYLRINALSVTLMHVPVIILASTMGPAAGAFLGFVFGCTSVIGATMTPGITSFVFSPFITVGGISGNFFSLVIALVPRILLGVIAGYVFKFAKKYATNTPVAAGIAAAVATVCHTIMVLGLIVILFGPQYSQALGISQAALNGVMAGVIGTNMIPEVIVAVVSNMALATALSSRYVGIAQQA